jgi:uncharacterized phage infection (PIP) family protein YhgE
MACVENIKMMQVLPFQPVIKVKSLVDNQNAVNDAQTAIQNKARKSFLNLRQQVTQITCQDVFPLVQDMIDAMKENPASQLVAQLAVKAANATNSATCSENEIATFQQLDADINATEVAISEELENVQSTLEGKPYKQICLLLFFPLFN